jgi:hypothetical protein
MKKNTLVIALLSFLLFMGHGHSQILQQSANWPNSNWNISGAYTNSGFVSDPRTTPNFSFDDDLAGSASLSDVISAESPVINLSAAFSGGEQQVQISFDYVYRRTGDRLYVEWWDGANWQILEQLNGNSTNLDYKSCSSMQSYVSQPLTISTFTTSQLIGFKYRIRYDGSGFYWGFCMGSPTIESLDTPPCLEVSSITIDSSSITFNSAEVSWSDNNATVPANGWEIEYGIAGFTQGSGTSITTTLNPYTLTGLDPDTTYDVYIRALCSNTEQSGWSGPISFTTPAIPVGCGGQFVDTGGSSGNYSNNEDITTTICPDNSGDVVTIQFLSFNTESCCDNLSIYDGPDATFPLVGTYAGTDIPPMYTSTDASGCLTFVFHSDGSITRDGWVANILCGPPPTCLAPTNLNVTNITETSAEFSWDDNNTPPPANGWEIIIVPQGQDPATGTPVFATSTPYVATGLNATTAYDFYVSAICDDNGNVDPSFMTGPLAFQTLVAPPACGGVFVDNGGPGENYPNNENVTYVICPDNAGDVVTLQFLSFNLENNWDFMTIYDGNSTASPQIGQYTGTNMPPITTSTDSTGCLTVVFTSDSIINREGWVANVICGPPPSCYSPSNIVVNNITHENAEISWTDNNTPPPANGWEVEIVPAGTAPTGTGVVTPNNPYLATGLDADTAYDVYVRAVCDDSGNDDPSFWIGPVTFETEITPPECGGIFTDDGGVDGNYSNSLDTTTIICPQNAGEIVSVEFISFDTEAGWDNLTIYDGDSTAAPLLGVFDGTDLPPTFISTHSSGCLTFVFHSDGVINRAGWEANVICMPEPSCWFVTNLSTGNTTVDSVEISWTDNLNTPPPAGGWNIEYGTTGFTPGTGTILNATSSPFIVTGLLSGTNYDFYVQAVCAADGTDSSDWVGPVQGRTDDAPPPNDTCATAIPLNVTLACEPIIGNNILATDSTVNEGEVMPNCADPAANGDLGYEALDVWYSFVVPSTGTVIVETSNAGGMVDTVLSAYTGTCGNLVELDCQDDSVIDPQSDDFRFSSLVLQNLNVGETVFVRVWSYPAYTSAGNAQQNIQGAFGICVYGQARNRDGLDVDQHDIEDINLAYYPNPVSDMLKIQSSSAINSIEVYNMLGQIVEKVYYQGDINEVQINMADITSGTYFVRVYTNNKQKSFTIIKE